MTSDELRKKIDTDPDFIYLKRFDYSLKKLLDRYPDGVPNNKIIAQALMISETEVDEIYEKIVLALRASLT